MTLLFSNFKCVVKNEMITLLLAMLEGNEKGSKIARRLANTLNDSRENITSIICFLDSHLQLQDLTTHEAFLAYDTNRDGWISPRFEHARISQLMLKLFIVVSFARPCRNKAVTVMSISSDCCKSLTPTEMGRFNTTLIGSLPCQRCHCFSQIDYLEFSNRFHEPIMSIGFNFVVLLTQLSQLGLNVS